MKKLLSLPACIIAALLFTSSASAFSVPDIHLKSEAKDTTLVTTPNDEANNKKASQLDVFVDTLLGKNIDKVPEKSVAE